MQNPGTAITTANMYYLFFSVLTKNSLHKFSWLLKHKGTYLWTVLLPKKILILGTKIIFLENSAQTLTSQRQLRE